MTSKINFENFKNGDKVIITISDKNEEEIYPCKIIDIVPTKKIIHFEDNESEYECKFSQVKSIVRTRKVIPYGTLIFLYLLLLIALIRFDSPISTYLADTPSLLVIIPILIFLDVLQFFRIKNDKLNVYEKQNNIPYVLSISTCVAIYPTLFMLIVSALEKVKKIGLLPFIWYFYLCLCLPFLTWIPGFIFFNKDQARLRQYKKNYLCKKYFMIRMIVFWICCLFLALMECAVLTMG